MRRGDRLLFGTRARPPGGRRLRFVLIASIVAGALSCGGARHRRVLGPPPEYEPPPAFTDLATTHEPGQDGGRAPRVRPADGGVP